MPRERIFELSNFEWYKGYWYIEGYSCTPDKLPSSYSTTAKSIPEAIETVEIYYGWNIRKCTVKTVNIASNETVAEYCNCSSNFELD